MVKVPFQDMLDNYRWIGLLVQATMQMGLTEKSISYLQSLTHQQQFA
jgi:hypothetical protein